MGAAANFGRDGTQSPAPDTANNINLNDHFSPREENLKESKSVSEFGDFETAFGSTIAQKENSDDFADFSSAFNVSNQPKPNQFSPTNLIGSSFQPNLISPGKV